MKTFYVFYMTVEWRLLLVLKCYCSMLVALNLFYSVGTLYKFTFERFDDK